jgi:hypothetical protein
MSQSPCKSLCFVLLSRAVCSTLLIMSCLGQGREQAASESPVAEKLLRNFLRQYLNITPCSEDPTTKYSVAWIDLNSNGRREAIVYITGREWCGSGGCTTLVLTRENSDYRVVARIPITRLPIRVLADTSHGWRKIGAWMQGGGIQPGYEAELSFDGRTYHLNPSISPARRLAKKAAGEVVVSSTQEGKPLCY